MLTKTFQFILKMDQRLRTCLCMVLLILVLFTFVQGVSLVAIGSLLGVSGSLALLCLGLIMGLMLMLWFGEVFEILREALGDSHPLVIMLADS